MDYKNLKKERMIWMIWIIILALCMVMGTEIMLWKLQENKLQKQENAYTDLLKKLSEEYKETVDGIYE